MANFKLTNITPISEEDFFKFLTNRKDILDGVCITGGEPTVNPGLSRFCKKIKGLGLEVKLDTNGSQPEILRKLIKNKLIDFVAMDVKSIFEEYSKAINAKCQTSNIKKSINLILKSGLEYEFRTTVVPGIHDKKILTKLAKQLRSLVVNCQLPVASYCWVLQQFQPENCLDPKYLKITPFSTKKMQDILTSVRKILPKTKLRSTD